MKQPITADDIRPGDLIRWESTTVDGLAREYRATGNEKQRPGDTGNLFRIGHPVADSLPTELTLGRLEWRIDGVTGSEVCEWIKFGRQMIGGSTGIPVDAVTRFTPVVAIDVALLQALGKIHHRALQLLDRPGSRDYWLAVDRFMSLVGNLAEQQHPGKS